MSAEHMGMVFAAEGLNGSEKLLLLGYTNWTDPYGYCWPSEQRLADDCGTSRSTVQRAKRELIKKKLLKSVRRVNSKGEPISNLSRVNLPLLASMARKRTSYDDNLIDQITFDDDTQGDPEATLRGTPDNPEPPADLLTHQSDSYPESNRLAPRVKMTPTPSQNDSQSRSYPEEIPNSLSRARVGKRPAPSGRGRSGEREKIAAPQKDKQATAAAPAGPVAEVPEQREHSEQQAAGDRIAAVWASERSALGTVTSQARKRTFGREAAGLLAQGIDAERLEQAARRMAERPTWFSLTKQVESMKVLPDVPAPSSGLPEWCGECGKGTPAARLNPRFRTLGELGRGEKCPRCHPEAVSVSA